MKQIHVSDDRAIAEPIKAASVILLRDGQDGGLEVFLLKRHAKSPFMGGMFVYPGGKVDREDLELIPGWDGRLLSDRERAAIGAKDWREHAVLRAAAIRELFEEAGVLLACRSGYSGEFLPTFSLPFLERTRTALLSGINTFARLVGEEHLRLAFDDLHYYAHWITAEASPVRFDAHFFLARHPVGQEARPDGRETTEGIWRSPTDALKENLTGDTPLSPPTLKILEGLVRQRRVDDVFGSLSDTPVLPILPILVSREETVIVFPWDPDYGDVRSGHASGADENGRVSGPLDTTARVVESGGIWRPYCKEPQ